MSAAPDRHRGVTLPRANMGQTTARNSHKVWSEVWNVKESLDDIRNRAARQHVRVCGSDPDDATGDAQGCASAKPEDSGQKASRKETPQEIQEARGSDYDDDSTVAIALATGGETRPFLPIVIRETALARPDAGRLRRARASTTSEAAPPRRFLSARTQILRASVPDSDTESQFWA
jgi:hypothetical protein